MKSFYSPDSMANVELKWAKEVKHFCGKKCPIILVANKIDIRTDQELIKELEKDHIVRNFIQYYQLFYFVVIVPIVSCETVQILILKDILE